MSEKLVKFLTPIVALFFATALGVTAATTIGTNIVTGGDLDVTGNSTLTGTLGVTGATTLGDLSAIGTFTASTTAAGSDVILKAMDDYDFDAADDMEIDAGDRILIGASDNGSGAYTTFQMFGSTGGLTIEGWDGTDSIANVSMSPQGGGISITYEDNTYSVGATLGTTGARLYADSDTDVILNAARAVPTTATDACVKGAIRYDASYIYICTATNTWKRATLATW